MITGSKEKIVRKDPGKERGLGMKRRMIKYRKENKVFG